MTLSSALEFTSYLSKERHYVPWTVGNGLILTARNLFFDTHLKKCFNVSIVIYSQTKYVLTGYSMIKRVFFVLA